ncbi:TIR-only protein-like [Tripterygium wilfordii]|uniref:TIR-only protein-like n=1 Tax=Tripterygium wilfordii TaxID=458696 RepID=UPI0018F8305B|nr:TIR-only protein-like [Tripterygium wilfordii]
MQRYIPSSPPPAANNLYRKILKTQQQFITINNRPPPCDVFINHRGIDTKRTIAGLLYHHLQRLRLNPFLDSKNMKPGDNLFHKIDSAIGRSKLGVAVFSPRYCDSYFCLHELALIMESKKKVIPIFCDVKPSELRVVDNGSCEAKEIQRFKWALEEAKYTVGLTFDSQRGDWSEFLTEATDAVIKNLLEVEGEGEGGRRIRKYVVQGLLK